MNNSILFVIGFVIFSTYLFFLVRMIWKQHKIQEQNDKKVIHLKHTEHQNESIAS